MTLLAQGESRRYGIRLYVLPCDARASRNFIGVALALEFRRVAQLHACRNEGNSGCLLKQVNNRQVSTGRANQGTPMVGRKAPGTPQPSDLAGVRPIIDRQAPAISSA